MRQFPPDATLDRLAERGELGIEQIDALAARLARFHLHECAIAAADSQYGDPETILQPVADNFSILDEIPGDSVRQLKLARLRDWSLAEHQRLAR